MADQPSTLSDSEITVLRALPAPAYPGITGVRLAELKHVSLYPEVHRLVELGLVQRVGRAFWKRTREGELWLREHTTYPDLMAALEESLGVVEDG